MPIPAWVAAALTRVGLAASLFLGLVGVVALRDRSRTVDAVTAVAGLVGAVASLVALRVQRRRAERSPTAPSLSGR